MYLAALFSEFPTLKIKLFLNVSIVFFISNDFFLRFSISIGILSKLEGKIILPSNSDKIPIEIENLKKKSFEIKKTIETLRNNLIFNVGNSEKSAAKHIVELLNQKKN